MIINLKFWRHKLVEFPVLKWAEGPEQRRPLGLHVSNRRGKFGISILTLSRLQGGPIAKQAGDETILLCKGPEDPVFGDELDPKLPDPCRVWLQARDEIGAGQRSTNHELLQMRTDGGHIPVHKPPVEVRDDINPPTLNRVTVEIGVMPYKSSILLKRI
jgi:hypothetical protein